MTNYLFSLIIIATFLMSCHTHKSNESIVELGTDGYFSNYTIQDADFGSKTTVSIVDDKRIMKTNALPNHTTGSFPNSGNPNTIKAQNRTYKFVINPVYTGKSKWVRQTGVAINGVKFEPGTAEVIQCESGENYRVEALQSMIDLGLDHNHAHVQPTGAYHYHGTPTGIVNDVNSETDLVHIGFAMDGFPIYYSKKGQFKASFRIIDEEREGADCVYENPHHSKEINIQGTQPDGTFLPDWEYIKGLGDLDECNGIMKDGKYMYLVTDEYPYIGRCLMGEYEEERRPRGPRPSRGRRGDRRPGFDSSRN
jgi:hypothetical protein